MAAWTTVLPLQQLRRAWPGRFPPAQTAADDESGGISRSLKSAELMASRQIRRRLDQTIPVEFRRRPL